MSFLFNRQPQLSSEQKLAQAEAEIDMVSDMYTRFVLPFPPVNPKTLPKTLLTSPTSKTIQLTTPSLLASCSKKCVDTSYREADLNKGESVCLDRCVAKFFEVNVKVSEKMQGEAQGRQGGAGGMFGA